MSEHAVDCITERNLEVGKAKSFIVCSQHEAFYSEKDTIFLNADFHTNVFKKRVHNKAERACV